MAYCESLPIQRAAVLIADPANLDDLEAAQRLQFPAWSWHHWQAWMSPGLCGALPSPKLACWLAGVPKQLDAEIQATLQALGVSRIVLMPGIDRMESLSTELACAGFECELWSENTFNAEHSASRSLICRIEQVSHDGLVVRSLMGGMSAPVHLREMHSGETQQFTEAKPIAHGAWLLPINKTLPWPVGSLLTAADAPLPVANQFEVTLYWSGDRAGLQGRTYQVELAGQRTHASFTAFKELLTKPASGRRTPKAAPKHGWIKANLAAEEALVYASQGELYGLRCGEVRDTETGDALGVFWINHSLRRSQNIHKQATTIARIDRERLNGHAGKVIWFTGLSGSGKSTLANALEVALHQRGLRTYILDGDNVRYGLNKDLGFTDADRVENIRRIAEVAKLMMEAGLIVMTAFISPFRRERDMARSLVGDTDFVEVFVSTPLSVCEQRDVKGLYKKARSGEIPNMTGINSPYEPPIQPSIVINTGEVTLGQAVEALVSLVSPSDD